VSSPDPKVSQVLPRDRRAVILIVDDDPAVRTSLAALLEENFEVVVAADVAEAETALGEGSIDVVLSDYDLPGEKGLAFLERLGANHPGAMGILVTGRGQEPSIQQAEYENVVVRVIHKPYEPARMIRWVESAVKLARMRQALNRISTRTKATSTGTL
jgi:DNA-binding NtrC family response regulator